MGRYTILCSLHCATRITTHFLPLSIGLWLNLAYSAQLCSYPAKHPPAYRIWNRILDQPRIELGKRGWTVLCIFQCRTSQLLSSSLHWIMVEYGLQCIVRKLSSKTPSCILHLKQHCRSTQNQVRYMEVHCLVQLWMQNKNITSIYKNITSILALSIWS